MKLAKVIKVLGRTGNTGNVTQVSPSVAPHTRAAARTHARALWSVVTAVVVHVKLWRCARARAVLSVALCGSRGCARVCAPLCWHMSAHERVPVCVWVCDK